MKSSTLFWCATALAACANVSTPTSVEAERLLEARRLLADDPDRALRITDELLKGNPGLAEARLLAAQGSRMLALEPNRGRADLFLRDAVTQLEKVTDAGNAAPETWLLLAECRFDLAEFDAAAGAAKVAAEGFAAAGEDDVDEPKLATALRLHADSELRLWIPKRQEEIDNGEANARGIVPPSEKNAEQAVRIIKNYHLAREHYPAEAATQTAIVYRYLQDDQKTQAAYEHGIQNHPDENAIHDAYIGWMTSIGQRAALAGAYRRFSAANPDAVILHWQYGRALFGQADGQRQQGNFQGAVANYDKAKTQFGEYSAVMPQHAASAAQWIALCELSAGRCLAEVGDLGGAETRLFAAANASPLAHAYDEIGQPVVRDSFGNHYQGLIDAIGAGHAESGDDALERTLAFHERVLARHPDQWGFVYNNAALAARDLGVKVERDGDSARAKELWETSYRYYEKAVGLWPDDARTINDCGLMLVYHLGRGYDRARECFDQAIELGTEQLAAMDESTDPGARENLEEAVGDAYQNIAVLLGNNLNRPFSEYREFCEQAVKYYPYQRREAAAILRNGGIAANATAAASTGASVAMAQQGGGKEAFEKAAPQAREKAAAGDIHGALAVLDKIQKECKDYAPFQALRGDYNLRLAKEKAQTGGSGVEFFFQDAINALKRAVELDSDPVEPRLLLADAYYQLSDFENAAKTASSLLLHMQSLGGGQAEHRNAAHTVRANAAARAYTAKKQAGEDAPELLSDARKSFRLLAAEGQTDGATLDLWATTELWAGAPAAAVRVYQDALAKNPDDAAMLGKFADTAINQNQVDLALGVLQKRRDPTGIWYLGKARYFEASNQRELGDPEQAVKTLDAARQAFEKSMAQNADYRASCERWIAMTLGKQGNIAFQAKDFDLAEDKLMQAVELCPEAIGDDLGLNESIKLGIALLADHYYQAGNLEKTEAIYRRASDAADSDLLMLNNSGLFARDYGNQLERQGKLKEAQEMYEQSYKAYRRAQQLDPTNVRLRNDCALIAIYHLERDWDEMKALLESAIADGKAQMADDPPEDRNERQNLDEAIGDCYENLALWHLKRSKDAKAAKAAAEQSMSHYPGARRPGARRHLRAAEQLLQGQ